MGKPLRSTGERGYGNAHQKLRARWRAVVEAGQAACQAEVCLMPDRRIIPGSPWDLGHKPGKMGYRGPEHRLCNRHEGQAISTAIQRAKRVLAPRQAPEPSRYTRW
jgi:hypothetical protein